MDAGSIAMYIAIGLALVELAKRIAEVVPGKKDDEIVGMVDGIFRAVVDAVAGRNVGTPNDPSARIRE